ncbi:bifunctional adenosylcobinamide kinase/adenosylcobinamide-phosphate guanylyltransferase [Fundicoccus culcitae]|uniref:Adenosylcobinamide kinase n=1 Tax=Fundicoccus culcitae TaxID=2969821 RepID=A0ABY5P4I5_9LACT|nr:bifunctional adenosylcobinamide kinase/adenosylcobinamide-phosphate guanylyltransferase [Fundicoccus culcitae]UUX33348.1 bifunctional adenosylcobinamide kinase/adenosylcobinamide-phosphate guanylyltransferase [Fundicoccus culcitae]
MSNIILVSGPVKSGKSSFAEKLVKGFNSEKVAYIATQANEFLDEEFKRRIVYHQAQRSSNWVTIEQFKYLDKFIRVSAITEKYQSILLDCVTLWINNLFFDHLEDYYKNKYKVNQLPNHFTLDDFVETFTNQDIEYMHRYLYREAHQLVKEMKRTDVNYVIVTNEVGWAIMPHTKIGRIFVDYYGTINQYIASEADEVYIVELGIPRRIKP